VATTIHLLGRPRVEGAGAGGGRTRGRKPWALLAYLALADRPVTRERMAGLLFGEADDPLGALRWSLAEARRTVGVPSAMTGDPLTLELPADVAVDVRVVLRSTWSAAEPFARAGGSLLEGMSFPANAAFDAWLAGERHHLAAVQANVLREGTLGRLAVGDHAGAVELARLLVERDPYDEGSHALLVRALLDAGDRPAAEYSAKRCVELFTRELGVAPSSAITAELDVRPAHRAVATATTRAAARAALDAGAAAVAAGAVELGLQRLGDAVARSSEAADVETEITALCELGYALVHSVRGRDEAGSAVLARAIARAAAHGTPAAATAAHRELGYVAFLAARYEAAFRHLDDASELAVGDDLELERAAIASIRGASLTDTAHYVEATATLERAVRAARAAEAGRWLVWSLTMTGRLRLLLGDAVGAREPLTEAFDRACRAGWTSVVPWPEALLAEVDLLDGNVEAAFEGASHAFALGCELRDPCWEETAGRVLAAVALAAGNVERARTTLLDARARGGRANDGWRFAHAEVLEALAALAPSFPSEGRRWITDLEVVAGAGGMRELLVRARLHRASLGEVGALEAAALLAEEIDNPSLTRSITRAAATIGPQPIEGAHHAQVRHRT